MKAVYFFLHVSFIVYVGGDKGQFSFPPMNPLTNSVISSDSPIYFSSEFQTPTPYFTNNYNKMPFKTLPSVNTKVYNTFPTAFPIILSSVKYDEDRNKGKDKGNEKMNMSSPMVFSNNQTKILTSKQEAEKRKFQTVSQTTNYKQPIDRMDTKITAQYSTPLESSNPLFVNQNSLSRKMIISEENDKNQDLEQKASFHNIHYAPPPNLFVQSTTEPAIPILRLSNEMDLDGSFSYEALGADQTHYVQNSRMENIGTDKEGQIVEGSYSYVGDNGQTYTVHYIADSNGYRATGDHLPVPPPIPEIIQRSIQYNLAEEAKRPPYLKTFTDVEDDTSPYSSENHSQSYLSTKRNLFTGRTPEAFSFAFTQGTTSQNNVTPMTNSKDPSKSNLEISENKIKRNINYGSLEPQITFLASHGAHLPLDAAPKSALPQLINYEPGLKESEQENTKALWRWQYGLNSDIPNVSKNSISRSFSEGDDIIINFDDMTPNEYTKMIRNNENSSGTLNYDSVTPREQLKDDSYNYVYLNNGLKIMTANNISKNKVNYDDSDIKSQLIPVNDVKFSTLGEAYESLDQNYNINQSDEVNIPTNDEPNETMELHNVYTFAPSTDIIPQWFDYENKPYESKRTIFNPEDTTNKMSKYPNILNTHLTVHPASHESTNSNGLKATINEETLSSSIVSPIEYNNVIQHQKSELQPLRTKHQEKFVIRNENEDTTTAENNIKEVINNNIFLKKLFTPQNHNSSKEEFQKNTEINHLKTVTRTLSKSINNESKPYNEIKLIEKRPLDMSDVLNYITNKNLFESNRLKIKRPLYLNKPNYGINVNSNYDITNTESKEDPQVHIYNNFRQYPQQQELHGVIKNYKVLQRNKVKNSILEQENQLLNKNMHTLKLPPPLGRAGPSMKSYLPPTY